VAAVVDFALTLPGVDPEKLALMGISMGSVLAPRAAAFEKRISALISNDGLYDFGAAVLAIFPPEQLEAAVAALTADEAPEMDRLLAEYVKTSTTAAWEIEHGMLYLAYPPHAPFLPRSSSTTCATVSPRRFRVRR
jgi:hypothetical protein